MGLLGGVSNDITKAGRLFAVRQAARLDAATEAALAALARSPRLASETLALSPLSAMLRSLRDRSPLAAYTFVPASKQPTFASGVKQVMTGVAGPKGSDLPTGRYLFKSRARAGEEYKDAADVVGADLVRMGGIPTPTVAMTSQVLQRDGKSYVGTLQEMVPNIGDLRPEDIARLNQRQLDELTQSHVGRWLISDHDGKPENYLKLADGHLRTIDLGQMYRFFGEDRLDRHFDPNGTPSAFNLMADAYVKGRLNIDFTKGLAQATRFQAISDEHFQDALRPFAELRYRQAGPIGGLATVKDFLQAATDRKNHLVVDLSAFYDSLAKERGLSGLDEALRTFKSTRPALIPDSSKALVPVQDTAPLIQKLGALGSEQAKETKAILFELFRIGPSHAQIHGTVDAILDRLGDRGAALLNASPDPLVQYMAQPHLEIYRLSKAAASGAEDVRQVAIDQLLEVAKNTRNANAYASKRAIASLMGTLDLSRPDEATHIATALFDPAFSDEQLKATREAIEARFGLPGRDLVRRSAPRA